MNALAIMQEQEREKRVRRERARRAAEAIISASPNDLAGYVIVPKEPTEAMLNAGASRTENEDPAFVVVRRVWRAMVEASQIKE